VFDPQDLRTLFQDAAGTTPVTGVEQPVGLMLDKGQGLELGPELVTNGGSETALPTGWYFPRGTVSRVTDSYQSGTASMLLTCGSTVGIKYAISNVILTVGKTYKLSAYVYLPSGQTTTTLSIGQAGIGLTTGTGETSLTDQWVKLEATVVAAYTTVSINGNAMDCNGDTWYIDNISVREIKGFHATQSTAASRPTLSARVNMLVGTDTLATQSVTTLATDYTLSFSGTGAVTLSGTATGTLSAGTNVFTATAGTLTLTVSGTVTNAQLVASNQASLEYQSVTSANVYDSDPSKFPWYLKFTDHWMVTPSIDATAYDKVMVACGLRKMSDASFCAAVEFSVSSASNYGSFILTAPWTSGGSDFGFRSRGSGAGTESALYALKPAPSSVAISGIGSISEDVSMLRVNGSPVTSPVDQGGGTFGNYPLYIGKRAGTLFPFNGYLYGLTVLFPTTLPNDNLIQALERYYAAKAGIVI
jgi:hypothetical protein